jgi:2-oxo-hept-3-ene-1,7-dioate hydratase
MLTDDQRRKAAADLLSAERNKKPIVQLSTTFPDITIEDAYAIQKHWVELRKKEGAKIAGHKIGLTSRAMQMASNMTEPDYGHLLQDMIYNDGDRIEAGLLINPRKQVELALVLGNPLKGTNIRIPDVLRATEFVTPALEIIDYRTDVPRKITDTIADNAAAAAMVVGGRTVRPFDIDLRWVGASLSQNATIEETGVSCGVMGHPAAGIAWLVNKLAAQDAGLEAGQIVLAGSFTRTVAVKSGDTFTANFGPLGALAVSFD